MASSTVQRCALLSPPRINIAKQQPVLSLLSLRRPFNTSNSQNITNEYNKSPTTPVNEALPQTPCVSSEPEASSNRIDPVALLSHPADGFHHPRQHLFTDRLVGRFYEDSSLDAETRKTTKCLAGRLGTAGAGSTRPSTTRGDAGLSPVFRSPSPTAEDFGCTRSSFRRMQGSTSIPSLNGGGGGGSGDGGGSKGVRSRAAGTNLSGRKGQVEKEILEQKALIEKLEGKMASLSSHGREVGRKNNAHGTAVGARGCTTLHDDTTSACQQNEEQGNQARGVAGRPASKPEHFGKLRDGGINGEHERCIEDISALRVQTMIRGAERRKRFLSLQAAREDLEHCLQVIVSLAGSLVTTEGSDVVAATAARLLASNLAGGLAKPPFDTLRSMYRLLLELEDIVSSLTTTNDTSTHAVTAAQRDDNGHACASMANSCAAAEIALDRIRDALGASGDIRGASSSLTLPLNLPEAHRLPVGSGRAAAIAAGSSGKGGILHSPETPVPSPHDTTSFATRYAGESPEHGPEGERDEEEGKQGSQREQQQGYGKHRPHRVPLSSLGVEEVGLLLRVNGFRQHAAGFVAQAVDGMMLSDPDLCETDFQELGLGGGGGEEGGIGSVSDQDIKTAGGTETPTALLLMFFQICQRDGVILPVTVTSEIATGTKHNEQAGVGDPGAELSLDGRASASEIRLEQCTGESQGNRMKERAGDNARLGAGVDHEILEHAGGPWRRSSMKLDRENQHVLVADISLDDVEGKPFECASTTADTSTTPAPDPAEATSGDRPRHMSVRLNRGVVVTKDGRDPDLVNDVDGPTNIDAGLETGEVKHGGGVVPRRSAAASTALNQGGKGRTSLGFVAVTLDVERDTNSSRETSLSQASLEGLQLQPGVVVTTIGEPVNIFR